MISKERLLAGLHELVHVEEGMVTLFVNFSKSLLKETKDIEPQKMEKMKNILTKLYRDSTRHKEMVDSVAEDVRKGSRDEY